MKTIKFKPWPFAGLVFLYYNRGGWSHLNQTRDMFTKAHFSIEMHKNTGNPRFRSIGVILGRLRASYCWMQGSFASWRWMLFQTLCIFAMYLCLQPDEHMRMWRAVVFGVLLVCYAELWKKATK